MTRLVNLRLAGFINGVRLTDVNRLLPLAMAGLGINIITSMLFFLAVPEQYTQNSAHSSPGWRTSNSAVLVFRAMDRCRRTLVVVLLILVPTQVHGQSSDDERSLLDLLPDLYVARNAALGLPVDSLFPFDLAGRISVRVTSLPFGSSAAGFTWTFVPATATFQRTSDSFGPTFTERPLTGGRNRFSFGVNYQRATFDKLDGLALEKGELRIVPQAFNPPALPSGPLLEDRFFLTLSTDTIGLFATYGITDRIDLGVVVPFVRAAMEARLETRLDRTNTGAFPAAAFFSKRASRTASGLGDMVVRAKYRFFSRPNTNLALSVDWRLPTGNESELRGRGGKAPKLLIVAATDVNRVSPHMNFGVTPRVTPYKYPASQAVNFYGYEIHYTGGVDVAVTPRFTVVGDLIGRIEADSEEFYEVGPDAALPFRKLHIRGGNVNQILGTAGIKFNPTATALISADALFPLNERGLTDNLTWMVGINFGF